MEHYKTLRQYAKYYGKETENLTKTYEKKVNQYVYRDLVNQKHPNIFFPYKQGETAMAVIETYLNKELKRHKVNKK